VLSLMLLAGCSHESADWKSAATADTTEAYQQFLGQYPKSANAPRARTRIQQLQQEHDWQVATAADSRAGYAQFLSQHPDSPNAQEARIRLENFAQAGTPVAAAGAAPAVKPAPARASRKSRVASTGVGAHYVQLGAYSSRATAESQWKRLSALFARELGALRPRYVAVKSHLGDVVRLQLAVNSRAQAEALCEKLKAHAQPCMTVSAG
jgi:hypothetical protein